VLAPCHSLNSASMYSVFCVLAKTAIFDVNNMTVAISNLCIRSVLVCAILNMGLNNNQPGEESSVNIFPISAIIDRLKKVEPFIW
jgi:hypothetical protein